MGEGARPCMCLWGQGQELRARCVATGGGFRGCYVGRRVIGFRLGRSREVLREDPSRCFVASV
eukprot:2165961-Pyramimonas_sp.AAC.1